MIARIVLALAFCLTPAFAQTPPTPPPPKTYTLPPDKLAQAIEYARARNRLYFVGVAYGIIVLLGVLALRVAPRIRDLARGPSIVQAFVFTALLLLLIDALNLPLAMYGRHLSVRFGQSIQGWGSWFLDWGKGELIEFVLSGFAVWLLYAVMRHSPQRWWFYCWLASIPLVLFMVFLQPMVIEPMFYKFRPLAERHPELVADMEKVVARGGLRIPPSRMFQMDASQKLKSLNAYVAGIGASKRVVVWDTTMEKMTTGETLFVFGHEMGHYVLGHMWIGIGASLAGLLFALWAGFHALRFSLAHWGGVWAIRKVDDLASLPVLMLAFAILSFIATPITSGISRVMEHQADTYGLELIHGIVPDSSQVAAQSFQILGETALSDPNPSPFIKFWLYDHPSVADRVRFASQYDPWDKGEQPRYVR